MPFFISLLHFKCCIKYFKVYLLIKPAKDTVSYQNEKLIHSSHTNTHNKELGVFDISTWAGIESIHDPFRCYIWILIVGYN